MPSASPVNDSSGAVAKPHGIIHSTKAWLEVVLLIFGVIAIPLGVKTWLEGEVEKSVSKTLSDETTLRKIATHSRPSLIFDAHESVVTDMGALPFINPQDIRVTKRTADGMPGHVHIGFVRQVSVVPILTSLHDPVDITYERGRGLGWEFELAWDRIPVGKKDSALMFRLEVMP